MKDFDINPLIHTTVLYYTVAFTIDNILGWRWEGPDMPLFFVVVLRSGSRFYSLVVSTDVNAANKKIENMKYGKRIRGKFFCDKIKKSTMDLSFYICFQAGLFESRFTRTFRLD